MFFINTSETNIIINFVIATVFAGVGYFLDCRIGTSIFWGILGLFNGSSHEFDVLAFIILSIYTLANIPINRKIATIKAKIPKPAKVTEPPALSIGDFAFYNKEKIVTYYRRLLCKYSDIESCETIENGHIESKAKHGVRRAVIGDLLAGGVGAAVGVYTAK